MYTFPIGVLLESFRTDAYGSLRLAASLGITGVQVLATRGELNADTVTANEKKLFLSKVKEQGLTVTALCGDFICGNPHVNFYTPECRTELIERSKRILNMAKELETNIVTTHIGVVPDDSSSERYKRMQDTCHELAEYAASLDSCFAVETGPEPVRTLKGFLDSVASSGLGVNFDPANIVMVTGDDPVNGVKLLGDYIVHTHAKDGIRLMVEDPNIIYGSFETRGLNVQYFEEVPLGRGSVDFPAYLKALEGVGYKGYLTIEREVGNQPFEDIKTAFNFLKALIK